MFTLNRVDVLEGMVNLKTRENNFLMPFLSASYLEEIRDAKKNLAKKRFCLITYFWNNVPGTRKVISYKASRIQDR